MSIQRVLCFFGDAQLPKNKFRFRTIYCLLVLLYPSSPSKVEQNTNPVEISCIEGNIKIDGHIDEPEWAAIAPVKLVSHWPEYGAESSSKTEIRIAYNDDYLFLSSKCFYGKDVQGTTFKRDAWGMNKDQVALILDTYNDNENALIFVVTPTGSRVDVTMINDASSGEFNLTRDSYWIAEVSQDEKGWYAQTRIPFTSLKFQSFDDTVTMGLIATVTISRYPILPPGQY